MLYNPLVHLNSIIRKSTESHLKLQSFRIAGEFYSVFGLYYFVWIWGWMVQTFVGIIIEQVTNTRPHSKFNENIFRGDQWTLSKDPKFTWKCIEIKQKCNNNKKIDTNYCLMLTKKQKQIANTKTAYALVIIILYTLGGNRRRGRRTKKTRHGQILCAIKKWPSTYHIRRDVYVQCMFLCICFWTVHELTMTLMH